MPLQRRDRDDARRALSWRDLAVAAEWKKFAGTAGRAEALRGRLQSVLKQRAALDATLARFQQRAALRDRAAELAEQEIAALRRRLATQDTAASAASDSHGDEASPEAGRPIAGERRLRRSRKRRARAVGMAERTGSEPPVCEAEYFIFQVVRRDCQTGRSLFAVDLPSDGIAVIALITA